MLPATVQAPLAPYETARPELALANSAKSGSPKVLSASASKVMLWSSFGTETCSGVGNVIVVGAYVPSPPNVACVTV